MGLPLAYSRKGVAAAACSRRAVAAFEAVRSRPLMVPERAVATPLEVEGAGLTAREEGLVLGLWF